MMTRPGREPAIAHVTQFAAERLLGHAHLERVGQPLHQIDHAPAHHAVNGWDRSVLDGHSKRPMVFVSQEQGRATAPAIDQARRPSVLSFTTQSRTIWTVTPPIAAASVRVAPS